MNLKPLWLSLFFITVVSGSILLMIYSISKYTGENNQKLINGYSVNTHYLEYNKKGQVYTRDFIPAAQHIAYHNTSFFTHPSILIYTEKRVPWYITADHGKSVKGSHLLYLSGHVKLHQPERKDHPETTVLTDEMTFYPKKSFAQTSHKVTVIRKNGQLSGVGATANFKTGVFQILRQTHGTKFSQKNPKKSTPQTSAGTHLSVMMGRM